MPSSIDIRRRIKSVKNIGQITKAMKMVAAARLRRAQEKAIASKPFTTKIREVLMHLAANSSDVSHPLLEVREVNRTGYLVLSADKGLAGAYSSNLMKEILAHFSETAVVESAEKTRSGNAKIAGKSQASAKRSSANAPAFDKSMAESFDNDLGQEVELQLVGKADTSFHIVGRKGRDYFRRRGYTIDREYIGFSEKPTYQHATMIAAELAKRFIAGEYDEIYMSYTVFHSPITQKPTTVKLLPLADQAVAGHGAAKEYIFEPSGEEVLSLLLPKYLETVIYGALLQSAASELAARMTAMGAATDNAEELISKLILNYNKIRQANITREISEIVGGANALK